eukprot:285794-Pelagomonas_calceolata.AAC.1
MQTQGACVFLFQLAFHLLPPHHSPPLPQAACQTSTYLHHCHILIIIQHLASLGINVHLLDVLVDIAQELWKAGKDAGTREERSISNCHGQQQQVPSNAVGIACQEWMGSGMCSARQAKRHAVIGDLLAAGPSAF